VGGEKTIDSSILVRIEASPAHNPEQKEEKRRKSRVRAESESKVRKVEEGEDLIKIEKRNTGVRRPDRGVLMGTIRDRDNNFLTS